MKNLYFCFIFSNLIQGNASIQRLAEQHGGQVVQQGDTHLICRFRLVQDGLRCISAIRESALTDAKSQLSVGISKLGEQAAHAIARHHPDGIGLDGTVFPDLDSQSAARFVPIRPAPENLPEAALWWQDRPEPTAPLSVLTEREHAVATLYAQGHTYQEIAQTLSRAPATIRTHLAAIYRKLNVSSKVELLHLFHGTSQTSATAHPAQEPGPAAPLSERRLLTFVVIEIAVSVPGGGTVDIETQLTVVDRISQCLAPELARLDGVWGHQFGQRLLACFGWPDADEDDALTAASFALRAQVLIAAATLPASVTVQCGIGLASGICVLRDVTQGNGLAKAFFGQNLMAAERCAQHAGPGRILADATMARALTGFFNLSPDHGPGGCMEITGQVSAPVRYISRIHPAHGPLVGRADELALLTNRWSRARQRTCQAILLTGDAGIGKSRLAHAIVQKALETNATIIAFQSAPQYQNTPLWPFARWLAAQALPDGDQANQLAQLYRYLAQFGETLGQSTPFFALMLGIGPADHDTFATLSPKQRREGMLDAVVQLILAMGKSTPLFLLFEDLHWADSSSREVLARLAASRSGLSIMIVATARNEGLDGDWKSSFDQLGLSGLDQRSAMILARRVAPIQNAHLLDTLVAQAGGVPLFIEELSRSLATTPHDPLENRIASEVPDTLTALLAARFDGLALNAAILHHAACIGRDFHRDLLIAVTDHPAKEVDAMIASLIEAGLVDQHGSASQAVFIFRHALFRDAIYGRILRSERQAMHARIAEVINQQYPELAARHPELVGYHLLQGGDPVTSAPLLIAAARAAMAKASYPEASALIECGLDALTTQDETPEQLAQGIDLRFLAYAARGLRGNPDKLLSLLKDAEVLAQRLDDPVRLCKALSSQTYLMASAGQIQAAIKVGKRNVAQMRLAVDRNMFVMGKLMLSRALYASGQYNETVLHSTRSLALLDRDVTADNREIGLLNQVYNAFGWAILGHAEMGAFTEAEALIDEATGLLPHLTGNSAHERLWLALAVARKCLLAGDHAGAVGILEPELDLCANHYPAYLPRIYSTLGASYIASGRIERGRTLLQEAETEAYAIGFRFGLAQVLILLGNALWVSGDTDAALAKIDAGVSLAQDIGEQGNEAWGLLAKARIAQDNGAAQHAQAFLLRSEQLAQTLDIRPLQNACTRFRSASGFEG